MNPSLEIGLIGGGFHHATSSTVGKDPKYFTYAKGRILNTTLFVDDAIHQNINTSCINKYGWIMEARGVVSHATNMVKVHHKEISEAYKVVFTHDKEIYTLEKNFVFLPSLGSWIESPNICDKTKLISMICSNKGWTYGHKVRLSWASRLRDSLDLYGNGFNPVDKKEQALCDYMFSVAIENDFYESWWSEKILDCFATGTIPIYLGAQDIGDYFNMDGIILLTDSLDLTTLTKEVYLNKQDAIRDNFERCLKYRASEDIMYENYFKGNI